VLAHLYMKLDTSSGEQNSFRESRCRSEK